MAGTFNEVVAPKLLTQWVDLKKDKAHCPACDSKKLQFQTSFCSLTGYRCHHGTEYKCKSCGELFIWHRYVSNDHKTSLHTWYVVDGIVFDGYAGCFETFNHLCKCGGIVIRRYTALDGITDTHFLGQNLQTGEKFYRIFFSCNWCGWKEESSTDRYWT